MTAVSFLMVLVLLVASARPHLNAKDGSAIVHPKADKRFPTSRWAVKLLNSEVDAHETARSHGFVNLGPAHFASHVGHVYIFEKLNTTGKDEPPHISSNTNVTWFQNQERRVRAKRDLRSPRDPLYSQQWNIHDTANVDLNILPVWHSGYTGKGVTIAVVDDGVFYTHPDLSNGYVADASFDFNHDDDDPTPYWYDYHGTAAAGVAAAEENSWCGVGVAPGANVSALRLLADMCTDEQEGAALSYRVDLNDIYSNSWGPTDDARRLEGPEMLAQAAIEHAITEGRNGKGSIFVWASGNGRSSGDNCNYDGYANSRYTVTIGSISQSGTTPFYSEGCSALIAVAPSSGSGREAKITATGRIDNKSPTCTDSFGGTSAAGPQAAGMAALLLEMRPDLTWRDVQGIFIRSSQVVDPEHSDWVTNDAGYTHNHDYGFGRLDGEKLMDVALSWKLFKKEKHYKLSFAGESNVPFEGCVTFSEDRKLKLEHVVIDVDISVGQRGKLALNLKSPSGIKSRLQEYHRDVAPNIVWSYMTVRNWGEHASGDWCLEVQSQDNIKAVLNSYTLHLYGHH